MKLYIKNKLASLTGSSEVTDENQNIIFRVKGKFLSLTHKKFIYNMNKELQYIVRNKFWKFILPSSYILSKDNEIIGKLTRNISLKSDYTLKNFKDEVRIDGDLISWHLDIYSNNKLIAKVRKNFTVFIDSFEVEVIDNKDAAFIVALIIALDNLQDNVHRR